MNRNSNIGLFLKLQLRLLGRFVRQIAPGLLLIMVIGVVAVAILISLPEFYIPCLLLLMVTAWQVRRKDKEFLTILFRRRPVAECAIEYAAAALPFVVITLAAGRWQELPLYLLAPLAAFLPGTGGRQWLISHPLLMRGSYEFITGFRPTSAVYALLFLGCVMGTAYGNRNLCLVSTGLWMFLMACFHGVPLRADYLLHYPSRRHFFLFKLSAITWDSTVLLLPFAVTMLLTDCSWATAADAAKVMLLSILLCSQMLSLRCLLENVIIQGIILFLFCFLAIAGFVQPWLLLADAAAALTLLLIAYTQLWIK